jgi:CheY-like chemotaxis protein/signal transduction histidine kinase/HAMP domain-containing protein
MKFYRNFSIRAKMVSMVLFIIALELMLAAASIYFLHNVNNTMSLIVEVDAEKLKLAGQIKTGLLEIHRSQKSSLLFTSRERVDREIIRRNRYLAEVRNALASIDRFTHPQERAAIQLMNILLMEFSEIDKRIELMVLERLKDNAADPATQAAAVALSTGSGRMAYERLASLVDSIVDGAEMDMAENRQCSIDQFNTMLLILLGICAFSILGGSFVGFHAARAISGNLEQLALVTDAIARGDHEVLVTVNSRDETGRLSASIRKMQAALRRVAIESADRDYVRTGLTRINDAMRGRVQITDVCAAVINETASYLQARVGAIFLMNDSGTEPMLEFSGGYAIDAQDRCPACFRLGEGLIGQAALNMTPIRVHDLPQGYIKVCSGLGDCCPSCIAIAPLVFDDHVNGVVELAFFEPPSDVQLDYLGQVLPAIAVTIETVSGREHLARSLTQEQVLNEELLQQQDELKAVNEELREQTLRLKGSEDKLRRQQEQLETVNAELEEKNSYLEQSKAMIERSNRELHHSRLNIEEKVEQLTLVSRYKTEFLANMSHELRTPLNSILLLSRMLGENKAGNLTEQQTRSAEIIYSSGNDLLTLINEVLDLARIEAGRMELHIEQIELRQVADSIAGQFEHLIEEKGLRFEVSVAEESPQYLNADPRRLGQIIRNLVSNALKFTETGEIVIRFGRPEPQDPLPAGLQRESTLAIAIRDTGIGIASDQQQAVFEAFQQLNHGAARKFPGTGLGLSISRELVQLMGGQIILSSLIGVGSTFTVYLPDKITRQIEATIPADGKGVPHGLGNHRPVPIESPTADAQSRLDDREHLEASDSAILIIEDDPVFAEVLMDLCRRKGCKALYAPTGEQGLTLAVDHIPKGIFLDIRLPGCDGWSVLESLKANPDTRHIPVHIISVEDDTRSALQKGAIGILCKPVAKEEIEQALGKLEDVFNRAMKDLLVIEDDKTLRQAIVSLVGNNDVHSDEAGSAAEALEMIRSKNYDCVVLDLGLPDMKGIDLLKQLEKEKGGQLPPVIVYTGKELTHEQEDELRPYSESIIIKGVCSQERLLDEASLFLHREVRKMPESKRKLITDLLDCDVVFRDKKILIVDDDLRNVFALSKLLEDKGAITFKAENGEKALTLLDSNACIDVVLIDMMMPVMDGYETMKRIRAKEHFRNLPLIALTAKAMSQDRVRCIEAGASDYLPKPVDMMRLFSMLRVWLYR